jgi:hypothetical protein
MINIHFSHCEVEKRENVKAWKRENLKTRKPENAKTRKFRVPGTSWSSQRESFFRVFAFSRFWGVNFTLVWFIAKNNYFGFLEIFFQNKMNKIRQQGSDDNYNDQSVSNPNEDKKVKTLRWGFRVI